MVFRRAFHLLLRVWAGPHRRSATIGLPRRDSKFIAFRAPAFDPSQKVCTLAAEIAMSSPPPRGTQPRWRRLAEPLCWAAAYLGGTITAKRSTVMRAFLLLVAMLIGLGSPAGAADDVAAAQNVIRSQVEAFGRDDAAAAYAHAAPAIQEMFPQADIFMAMVRGSYAPVYRHRSFEFGEARSRGRQDRPARPHRRCRGRAVGGALYAGAAARRQPQDFRMHAAEGRSGGVTALRAGIAPPAT